MVQIPLTRSGDAPASQRPTASAGAARLLHSTQVRAGLILLLAMMAFALLGPLFAPHDPEQTIAPPYADPTGDMPLGADELGRDVLSRVISGGVYLAWMAPSAAVAAVVLGATAGIVAAYFGGIADLLLMRAMDVILAFPALLFTLLFVSVVGPKPWLLVLLVTIGMTPGVARVIRGAAIPLNKREYVMWARTVGIRHRTVLLREFLPNVSSPLLVELGMRLMWAIVVFASVSFVGYGIQPPTADWGLMVSENRTGLQGQPLAVLAPAVCIIAFTVGGNLIAEGAGRVIARTEGSE